MLADCLVPVRVSHDDRTTDVFNHLLPLIALISEQDARAVGQVLILRRRLLTIVLVPLVRRF